MRHQEFMLKGAHVTYDCLESIIFDIMATKKIYFVPSCLLLQNSQKQSAKSSAQGDVLQSNSTGRPVDSRGRPIEILLDVQQKFLLRFSMKLAILRHLKQTYKILVDVQQNPTGRPVESRGRPIEVLQDVLQSRRFGPLYWVEVLFLFIGGVQVLWVF